MAEEDALKLYWEHFFKAETGTYEKSAWLDLFLAEYLIRVNDGANPKDLINFCPVSGVVSLVGCELLCGIHRVTSSVSALAAPPLPPREGFCSGKVPTAIDAFEELEPKDESRGQSTSLFTRHNAQSSLEILRQYLLGGVAWRCLQLLRTLGVEGLSCCRQLSSVLIWLFGELSADLVTSGLEESPATSANENKSTITLKTSCAKTPIHQLFSHKIWSKQINSGSQGSKNSNPSPEKSVSGRSRLNQAKSEDRTKRKQTKYTDHSTESADSNEDLQILNKSLTIKLSSKNDDFEYFNSPRSNEFPNESLYSDPFFVPKRPKPKADDYMNDKHREIIKSQISTFEFTLIITDLLQELCRTESSLSGSEGSQIAMQCINFSLRNLCSLQFGSMPSHAIHYDCDQVSIIKVALTELLIVSLDKVLLHSDLCAKLINNGILPMLLRILEDVICKNSPKYQSKEEQNRAKQEKPNKTESENLLKFVFGIAYSITAFFHCLLMQCRSVDKLKEFTDQFKLYGECMKGGLLKDCIELMIRIPAEQEDVLILIKKLIESLGKLISGMKRVRSEIVHSAACPRSRHKVCRQRVVAGMHHHHDILGEAGTGLPMSSACCISVLYGTLASLVTDDEVAAQNTLRNKILRTMLNCGVCCCFSPGFLMESIVRLMLTHNSVATLCLQVLEQTVYGELGASVLLPKVTDQLPCSICEPCDDKRDLVRKYCPHGVSPVERKSVWSFLIHYNSLLQLDNHNNVLHATVSHILRVTPKCRMEMKYELLFSVIYPTFIVAKHRYIIRMEESAYFLTVACLNIFANLLNTVSFAEQFIQKGGLSYVLELISQSEFSNQCCSILEIAIIVEIFKLMKENNDMSYFREMSSLASVQMLFKSLSEMSEKCLKIYKLKLPVEKYEELCDIASERQSLSLPTQNRTEGLRKHSIAISIKSYVTNENSVEESIEDYLEVLKNIYTFWKSCSSLCLYSPMFREYIVGEDVFLESFVLLKVLLYYICHCECNASEIRLLIKIVEALLTVQFAVADVTSGRSKETSSCVVRSALEAGGEALQRGGGAALRALCEALIRVALAQPSTRHAMPKPHAPKVPPLGCPSGNSSVDCSSSEDSSAGPYASEHSEPTSRPDEGYEADVEIGKLELLSLTKSKKLTETIGRAGLGADAIVDECLEYSKSGELAHPELCVIVVDVLTHLVNKLLKSGRGGDGLEMSAAGASLARACCARLSSALARARHSPQMLSRLLAPEAAQVLACDDIQLRDLQRSVLELIHVLASQSISSAELASFLRLFVAESPPLTLLLGALRRLAECASTNTPDCILTFPVDSDTVNVELAEDLKYVVVSSATSQSQQAENMAKMLQESHTRAGVLSPWSVGAARCGFEGAGWAPWLQGFAMLLWIRPHNTDTVQAASPHGEDELDTMDDWQEATDNESKKPPLKKDTSPVRANELSHVASIGHDSLIFEVWFDTCSGCFTFRLSRPEAGSSKIVSEARAESALPAQRWSCVAINVKEYVHKRRIHVQVTVFINGCETETVGLPLQGVLVRKVTPTSIVIGHATRGNDARGLAAGSGGYHLSSVHVYRSPTITVYHALHLTAHGPDHACRVHCDSPNFPLVLTPNVLDSKIDWDQVFEMSNATLRELHDNLILTFSAYAPNIMNLYHQTVALPTVFAGRVPTANIMSASASALPAAGGSGSSIPETLYTVWRGSPMPSRHRGLGPAVYMLGGPDVLLYLFARVVELNGTAEEQATALSIVLRSCRIDNRLYAALYDEDKLDMLHTVLASNKCIVSHHMLKVILDEACSSSVITVSGTSVLVQARSDAVLLEPRLLLLLTKAWKQFDTSEEITWEEESSSGVRHTIRGSLWGLALRCKRVLVRDGESDGDEHPRRAFNHYQMSRVDLLRHLLVACKERFLNSECGPLEPCASHWLVSLARALMGSPPQLQRLALLNDFLLLMHQASDTFVTHSRANFFFLLTPDTQDMAEYQTKKRSSRRHKKRANTDEARSSSSVTSEDIIVENVINNYSSKESQERGDEGGEGSTAGEERENLEQSGGSLKHVKGIINAQIREGRKHKISSTSENSDVTIERSDAASSGHASAIAEEGEGQRSELNEYVVVDAEDVHHTTVEVYASGIYQQQKVRAGAEPGWSACEGLLLLLRDTVAVLPESALTHLGACVQAESLAVLANHRSGRVRAALMRCVASLQRRASPELIKRLRHSLYYFHLANQISLYEGSWELASACAALLTKCDVPLEDQLDDDIWVDMSEDSVQRSPPLLALLPCCLSDVPLAHNITLIIRRIIDKASIKVLNEISVVEVVVRSIRAIGQMEDDTFEGRHLLLEDLHELLSKIAIKALSSPNGMQMLTDMHNMLTYVEPSAGEVARLAQLALFTAQLDYLEERLHSSYTAHTKYSNYFTTVLSSAVSLGLEGVSRAERTELASRHEAVVGRAVAFLTAQPPDRSAEPLAPLLERLLATLLPACSGERGRWWTGFGGGGEAAAALRDLFWWAASPAPGLRPLQPRLLRALYLAPPPTLNILTPQDPPAMRKLAVYLLAILKNIHAEAEAGMPTVELPITDWARSWAVATQAGLADRVPSETLPVEAERLLAADEAKWAKAVEKQMIQVKKAVFSKESIASKLTESAMAMTRAVVEAQNAHRKTFLQHLRRAHSHAAAAKTRWARMRDQYVHPRAVWHEPRSYPSSWQLDATEGPGRVRVRLRPAHLDIPPRFLKPEARHKAESAHLPPPLSSVLGFGSGLRGGLVARLQLNETVAFMTTVTYITVASETPGELLLSDRSIHFVPEDIDEVPEPPSTNPRKRDKRPEQRSGAASWPLEAVVQVATRRWCLQETAAELFLSSGHAHLLAFADVNQRSAFLKALGNCHLPSKVEPDTLQEAMTQWRNGAITNWEYLMRLNGLGGRSYNDLMQYPVLPFVIADYSSRILDLTDPKSFRDLSKPMAIQNKNREQHYINTYNIKVEPDTLQEAMTQWRNGAITNWEYLMRLNGLGGRSYNDLMQYPVLPFVIADYSSRILDLTDPKSFRDLSKPMAIQNKNREQHYINTYNDLKAARREGCSPLLSRQPHHYASLYSNSGGVLHYLVRLPPFTELFLNYQDNNFDMPDRTFHSLATTWRLITNDSPTDVKELIPELFYLPELFHNNEGLDLGVRQCGAAIDSVELPAWAPDSRLFTLIHRQALEAPLVTEKLPLWIDLVFGYKQTGQAAVDALNVFPACTYYGFDPLALEDEVDRTAAAAMVRTYGQAPRQLLKHPHPHATNDLHSTTDDAQKQVWAGVEGARWGRYCGSPALGPATVVARRSCAGACATQPLPHKRAVALCPNNTALVALPGSSMASASPGSSTAPCGLALLSWGHSDAVIRLKRRRDAPPHLLMHVPPLDQVTKVATSCTLQGSPSPVFVGHASGRVIALRLRYDAQAHASTHNASPTARATPLHAHRAAVVDIHVCSRAGLLVTASVDGVIVLWDLNSLSYIRTLPNRDMLPVSHVTVSETLCDVASAHEARRGHTHTPRGDAADDADGDDAGSYEKDDTFKHKSLIRVHTCNARFVGSVKVAERVTCICYSNAPEGISVNSIAAGLASGAVRLYSSWDLRKVAYIPPMDKPTPLLSLTYSSDSSLLFGCYADGWCVAWESGTSTNGKPQPAKMLPAHALL